MLVKQSFLFIRGIISIEQQKMVVNMKFDIAMKFVMVTISNIEFWKNFPEMDMTDTVRRI